MFYCTYIGYVDDLEEDDEEQMYSDLESEAEAEEEESQISKKQTADKGKSIFIDGYFLNNMFNIP